MSHKIAIIDDSELHRIEIKKLLLSHQFEVVEANDDGEGLKILRENKDISLLLCDFHMPVLDGLSMLEQYQKSDGARQFPVFLVTTESSAELKKRGKVLGVCAWITKPFSPEKVLAAVRHVLKLT